MSGVEPESLNRTVQCDTITPQEFVFDCTLRQKQTSTIIFYNTWVNFTKHAQIIFMIFKRNCFVAI